MRIKQALILAGGLGKRLGVKSMNCPKPMQPVNGEPFLNNLIFPEYVLRHLALHMKNPPATTDSDLNLVVALQKHDLIDDKKMFLFEIPEKSIFIHNSSKLFVKLYKRRKRYICKELSSGKNYLFSPVARIKLNKL